MVSSGCEGARHGLAWDGDPVVELIRVNVNEIRLLERERGQTANVADLVRVLGVRLDILLLKELRDLQPVLQRLKADYHRLAVTRDLNTAHMNEMVDWNLQNLFTRN